MRICPQPSAWHEIYLRLKVYADQRECTPRLPPIPLILSGWAYTNDAEKLQRWESTVDWAARNGCPDLVAGLAPEDYYCVDVPTAYVVGPGGGPMYRSWDSEPGAKPDAERLAYLLGKLNSEWTETVGQELAKITRPSEFAGTKARRLVVQADTSALPPWGTWTELASDEAQRRSFTRLRAAINAAISPHEVDHIDFIPKES